VTDARDGDWEPVVAGRRVQLLRTTGGRGKLIGFGTEVLTSENGTLDVLTSCFPDRTAGWAPLLREIAPPSPAAARATLGLLDGRNR
jgi:malate dehydrogenase (quinone)